MSEAENTKNWALDELIDYVNSWSETQSKASYPDSYQANMPGDETEDYKNWALDELMNYLDALPESNNILDNAATPRCDFAEQTLRENSLIKANSREILNISRQQPQEIINSNNFSEQVAAKNTEQVALAPTNMANLAAFIQELRSSNSYLVKRVTDLSQAIVEIQKTLEFHKERNQVAETMLREKDRALETACQTIECQQNLIESLNAELATHKEFVVQSQAICSEQSYQLQEAKNDCRELRTRLHREQQHSIQLKFALEKCLATPAINHQTDLEADLNVPKAPPIKTWSIKKPRSDREIELDWERHQPEINSISEVAVVETNEPNISLENTIAGEELASNYDNEIIEVQWQELANLVENNLQDEAIANLTADILAELDEAPNTASPMETSYINANKNWPSPVVYPSRPPKGRKSLAAIELPPFRRRRA